MNVPLPFAPGGFDEQLGAWVRLAARPGCETRPALFLDRDGVIIEDSGYLCRPSDMVLIPGAVETIALANRAGVPVIEVSNQAGIARGYFGWTEFLQVEQALARELAAGGAWMDAAYACPYHRDGIEPWARAQHPARKPRPGMLLAAARHLNLDLARSWIIGDKLADVLAGRNAGLRGALHVLTGHGPEHRQAVCEARSPDFDLRLGQSIRDAAPLIPA